MPFSTNRRIAAWQLGAYLLIVVIGVLGFSAIANTQDDIQETQNEQCVDSQENRQAIRDLTTGIKNLGIGFIDGPPTEWTAREKAFAQYMQDFEDEQLEKLPIPSCDIK